MENVGNQDGSQESPFLDETGSPTISYNEKQVLDDTQEVKLKQELLDNHLDTSPMSSDEKLNSHIEEGEPCEPHSVEIEAHEKYNTESQDLERNSNQYASKIPLLASACLNQDRDAIVRLAAEEGGLVDDNIRQMACGLISLCIMICF